MLPQYKGRTIIFFAVIYLVFSAVLLYLLFFNIGLQIEEQLDLVRGTKSIFVRNETRRNIYDISVSYIQSGQKQRILYIRNMKPAESREIKYDFQTEDDIIELVVEAPYHQTLSRKIMLGKGVTGLEYKFQIPQKIFKGVGFLVEMEVCNTTREIKEALVEESHGTEFVEPSGTTTALAVGASDCSVVEYSFTPKETGPTVINFNINVQNITDSRKLRITVED